MKVRHGFVSNSSSSSFVIVGSESIKTVNANDDHAFILEGVNRDLFLSTMHCSELKEDEIEKIKAADQIALTRFLGDYSTNDEHFGFEDNYGYGKALPPPPSYTCYDYMSGGHGGPYSEDYVHKVHDGIFILKEYPYED